MKLSIITINFNNALGLKRTLDSVLSQSWNDYEYIVIDGASNDGSKEIIESYSDRLSAWVSESDSGIYSAMNKGIKLAKGEYCLFLNSGDFLIGNDILYKIFQYSFTSDIVSFSVINTDGIESFIKKPPQNISFYSFVGGSLPHPSTLIRRTIFDRIGLYDESKKIISDWCFFIEVLIVHNCSYISFDDVLSIFDRSGTSVSTNNTELRGKEVRDYLDANFPRIIGDYQFPEYCMNTLCFVFSNFSSTLFSICFFPMRIINRLFLLRNRLRRKIYSEKIYYKFPEK